MFYVVNDNPYKKVLMFAIQNYFFFVFYLRGCPISTERSKAVCVNFQAVTGTYGQFIAPINTVNFDVMQFSPRTR